MSNTIDTKTLTSVIKSKGYWTISFTPNELNENGNNTLPECKTILSSSAVRLRGWPYPATGNDNSHDPIAMENYVEAQTNFEDCKEICRLYQSQKFVHLLGLREDWYTPEGIQRHYWIPQNETKILSIIGTVYQFTECFEFLSELARKGLYGNGVEIEIGLHNSNGRVLVTESNRGPLFDTYKCHPKDVNLKKRLSSEQIITEGRVVAIDLLVELFNRFNWNNPPRGVFEEDQRKLLSRQI